MKKIKLTQNKFALIDDEFYPSFLKFKWYYGEGYAKRNVWKPKHMVIRLHHLILPKKMGFDVDHINGNTLDNRRVNLRYVTRKQNLHNQGIRGDNTSGYKGVSKFREKFWRAYIVVDYKQISLGIHNTKEEAAKAYNKAAKEFHGEYARLNKL